MKSAIALGLVLGLIGLVPLFGGPRYEAALVAGLIAPLWAAVAASIEAGIEVRKRTGDSQQDGLRRFLPGSQALLQGIIVGWNHVVAILVMALLHGLRVGFCEPGRGFALLVLGPGLGVVLAALLGALVGTFVALVGGGRRGRLVAPGLAAAFPLGSAVLGLFHFYSSPAVYSYDPFVGYFSGPLYDTVVYDIERLLSFRAGTVMTLVALSSVVSSLTFVFEKEKARPSLNASSRQGLAVVVLGALSAVGSLWHSAAAEELGHSSSQESIREALGRVTTVGRCTVYFSAGVEAQVAKRTANECVGHLAQLENYFELEPTGAVQVFLFANAEEKRQQMGAATTYIAKPWRREIYLQPSSFPHQVLGHELAHVVTGDFGSGPLRIAGLLGGWLPDPGRIEGFAEAASPRENSEGTLHEWTAAMKKLDLLPSLHSLFRLTFLGNSAARSYSAAGSFVDFVREEHGADVLRQWYAGADLEVLTKTTWPDLEKQWHAFLDGIEIPSDVLEIARPRFSRPGVFERKCPHAVDRAIAEAHSYCPVQEAKARRIAAEAIEMDPAKKDIELAMARCGWFSGDAKRSLEELTRLAAAEDAYEPNARRGAYDFAGNIAWNQGQLEKSAKLYGHAKALAYRRGHIRNLEVKEWAVTQSAEVREPLRALLAPKRIESTLPLARLARLAEGKEAPDLGKYLLARASLNAGVQDRDLLATIEPQGLPFESLRRELGRMRLLTACEEAMKAPQEKSLESALAKYLKQPLSAAERREGQRVAERCRTAGKLRREGQ